MGYYYAIVNNEGIVIGIRHNETELFEQNYILVDASFDPHRKKYVNGEWIDYTPEPDPMENALSDEQQAQLEMQADIQYLVDLAEINMEV